jgi:hypothetical protein
MTAMKFTIELEIGRSFLLLGPHVDNSVTYQAVLPCRRETVAFVAELLRQQRGALGTRAGRRALDCLAQAVLACRSRPSSPVPALPACSRLTSGSRRRRR